MCLSWLRAMRWPLRSSEYIFSAELCLLNCCLDSLPLHFNVCCLQGQTLFLIDLRRPGGVPSVPERFCRCGEEAEQWRGKDRVTMQDPFVQGPTPQRSKLTKDPGLCGRLSLCIKTALSEDTTALPRKVLLKGPAASNPVL